MEFATNFKKHPRKRESFTNTKQKVYKVSVNKKTGERELVVDKEVDIYEKIQEYREEVKISNILQRYDLDMLKQLKKDEEQLIDLTNMPENLMETMQAIDSAKYAWDRQSKVIKAKFDNDFNKFIASAENGQLATMLNNELKTSMDKFKLNNQANYVTPVKPAAQATTTQQQVITPMQEPTQQVVQPTQQVTGGMTNV